MVEQEEERSRVRSATYVIGSLILAICFGIGLNGLASNHSILVQLGQHVPFLKTIGEYFHGKSYPIESGSIPAFSPPTGELYPTWDWNVVGNRPGARFMTDVEIAFKEEGGTRPFLVILGNVFDVTTNYQSYQAGSGYHGFIGRDASRAFVSGDFTPEGLTDDLDGLTAEDFKGLVNWLSFYYKTYPHVGYHIGRFFDQDGKETDYYQMVRMRVKEADVNAEADGNIKKQFPPCNMEWSAKTEVTEYWCSNKSGGIERDWEGYPYQFQESEDKSFRCACLHTNNLKDTRVKPFEGCEPKSRRCKVRTPKK